MRNTAVYEIPDLLEGILEGRRQSIPTESGMQLPLAISPM